VLIGNPLGELNKDFGKILENRGDIVSSLNGKVASFVGNVRPFFDPRSYPILMSNRGSLLLAGATLPSLAVILLQIFGIVSATTAAKINILDYMFIGMLLMTSYFSKEGKAARLQIQEEKKSKQQEKGIGDNKQVFEMRDMNPESKEGS